MTHATDTPADTPADAPTVPRPEVAPPGPWSFPIPRERLLDNGARLLAYDIPGQYVVSVRLAVPLSLAAEPVELEGISTVMGRLLDEGTVRHPAEEFAGLLERKGIALGVGISDAALGLDADVPKRWLGEALDLLTQMLAEPAFPTAEVRRVVSTRVAEIEQERASAPHRAAREFIATYYDPADRASRPTGGSADTVQALTRESIAAHHRRTIGPRGATVVVAGDLGGLDVDRLVDATLGAWTNPEHEPPAPPVPARRAPDAARVVVVDRPGSVQTEFAIGWTGPDRHVEPCWAAYPVLGYLIGGSPNARIDAVLREEKGFTYGIRSSFRPRRAGGVFMTTGSVRGDATVESLALLRQILDTARDGFTDDEVRVGVDFIARTAPGRYATADAVADEAVMLGLDRLPLTFTTDNLAHMAALTAADLGAAYDRFVSGEWAVVVVGDAQSWVEQVRAAGHEVTVVAN